MTEVDEALTRKGATDRFSRTSATTVRRLASWRKLRGPKAGRTCRCFLRSDLVAYVRGWRGAVS